MRIALKLFIYLELVNITEFILCFISNEAYFTPLLCTNGYAGYMPFVSFSNEVDSHFVTIPQLSISTFLFLKYMRESIIYEPKSDISNRLTT